MSTAVKLDSVIFVDSIDGFNNGIDVEELKRILRGVGYV